MGFLGSFVQFCLQATDIGPKGLHQEILTAHLSPVLGYVDAVGIQFHVQLQQNAYNRGSVSVPSPESTASTCRWASSTCPANQATRPT